VCERESMCVCVCVVANFFGAHTQVNVFVCEYVCLCVCGRVFYLHNASVIV